ncbi:MAG: 1,4-alpha-glucan branching enzyme, partial [bacterium]
MSTLEEGTRQALLHARHGNPHDVLGAHEHTAAGRPATIIRVYQPEAADCYVVREGVATAMRAEGDGFFALVLPGVSLPVRYSLRFLSQDGRTWERGDAYRHLPTVGETDLYLFNEGTHRQLWTVLGAHLRTVEGDEGTSFVVWAPNAERVSVVGDWCNW